ncbi:hypothetical protein J6590_086505 [Homalodisca vitripennis]|nr:hypothetical protein J6590_086505 [Homalodisca vitripennis]
MAFVSRSATRGSSRAMPVLIADTSDLISATSLEILSIWLTFPMSSSSFAMTEPICALSWVTGAAGDEVQPFREQNQQTEEYTRPAVQTGALTGLPDKQTDRQERDGEERDQECGYGNSTGIAGTGTATLVWDWVWACGQQHTGI